MPTPQEKRFDAYLELCDTLDNSGQLRIPVHEYVFEDYLTRGIDETARHEHQGLPTLPWGEALDIAFQDAPQTRSAYESDAILESDEIYSNLDTAIFYGSPTHTEKWKKEFTKLLSGHVTTPEAAEAFVQQYIDTRKKLVLEVNDPSRGR